MKDLLKYSSSVDAFYLTLREDEVDDTREVEPGVMVDYNAAGDVIGIEILDFMQRLNEIASISSPPSVGVTASTPAAHEMPGDKGSSQGSVEKVTS